MPYLSKSVISRYIGTECRRQLRLSLSPVNDRYQHERDAAGMPPEQPPRPGLQLIRQAGDLWEAEKLHDLTETFGDAAVMGRRQVMASGAVRYQPAPLEDALREARAGRFLAQAKYEIGSSVQAALGIADYRAELDLDFAAVVPDLIEVLAAGTCTEVVTPAGEVEPLPDGDGRRQLRVIDIKLTAEPSPGYFAEAAYYMIALAGWLKDSGQDQRFVVVRDGALWPGSHDASALRKEHRRQMQDGGAIDTAALHTALNADLEPVPFDVFALRLRRFFREELPRVLRTPWRELEWHVDTRCSGCDYLGLPGLKDPHPDHCLPAAEREGHLSRVADISRGAGAALRAGGVVDVAALAQRLPADAVYDTHQRLRAGRSVVAARAAALQTRLPAIPADAGTSAVMPAWADLHIYLSADFDQGSAISIAFGIKAFWLEHREYGDANPARREQRTWDRVFVVDQRGLDVERRELLAFLQEIKGILDFAAAQDKNTTFQVYLWDRLQYEHLARIIGRHLEAILTDRSIAHLAWLFPSEDLLPNPAMSTRRSPITIVRDVVRAVLAAPVPHYYSLLEIARGYHVEGLPESIARFSVHPLFEVQLSDQIPSERAHDIWSRGPSWLERLQTLRQTVERRLAALEAVTRRLEADLKGRLKQSAPKAGVEPPKPVGGAAFDGELWYAFARLDEALAELEVHSVWAMPAHEREARFHSARLSHRLTGEEARQALDRQRLLPSPRRRVYALLSGSREVKLREGDFNFALAPESSAGFLELGFGMVTRGTPLEPPEGDRRRWMPMWEMTRVTVAGIDRDAGVVVLDPDRRSEGVLDDLERFGVAGFTRDVVLDPVHRGFFTRMLRAALQAIGNPPSAQANPQVLRAMGQAGRRGANRRPETPVASVLWDARTLHETRVERGLGPVRARLEAAGLPLNATQWRAWEAALSRRLALIWGPPGTGKSRTARAAVAGAALAARTADRPLRVLVCAATYTALDNVLLPVERDLGALLGGTDYHVRRLRSPSRRRDRDVPEAIDLEVNRASPSRPLKELIERLADERGITVVGATPQQVHNLLTAGERPPLQPLFDLILIDEASQMDVAHAIVALCALAAGGSVVLAGDPLQLPPIHQAEAPLGLESMVGSIYQYFAERHAIPAVMLDLNYRSNATIVGFSRRTGYGPGLTSYSPDLRLNLTEPLPGTRPADWPASLHWTPEWAALLDPEKPVACFIYPEGRSSQWNRFEADSVAALIRVLAGRVGQQPAGERDPATGALRPHDAAPYGRDAFWQRAVGVVTPHRAQQGLVVARLHEVFRGSGVSQATIRDAVDTVERFQGQERDVIIASFALGDPDAIADEDEFLYSLNRFNVMASRARTKLVVLVSREIVDHIAGEVETLRASGLLKVFAESYCADPRPMTLGFLDGDAVARVDGVFRTR